MAKIDKFDFRDCRQAAAKRPEAAIIDSCAVIARYVGVYRIHALIVGE